MSLVCVGTIVGVHGIKGAVKIKSYTQVPDDLLSFSPVTLADGRTLALKPASKGGAASQTILAHIAGVQDRTEAEVYVSLDLYVERDRLPPVSEEGTYYISDLEGLPVHVGGQKVGSVQSLENHGAGDLLNVAISDLVISIPFHKEFVAVVEGDVPFLEVDPAYFASLKALYE